MTARLAIKLIEEEKSSIIDQFALQNKFDKENYSLLHKLIEKKSSYFKIADTFSLEISKVKIFLQDLKKPNIIQRYAKIFGINNDLPPYLSMSLVQVKLTCLV